jgi:hypothetical protein
MTGRQEYDRNMTGRQDERQEYDRQRTLDKYMINWCVSINPDKIVQDKLYTIMISDIVFLLLQYMKYHGKQCMLGDTHRRPTIIRKTGD